MSTSFGDILDYETAMRFSQSPPFNPNWFVFGKDKYFNFWLCSKVDYGTELYFTYWDHAAGTEIEEPVWEDLPSFLLDMKEESEEF